MLLIIQHSIFVHLHCISFSYISTFSFIFIAYIVNPDSDILEKQSYGQFNDKTKQVFVSPNIQLMDPDSYIPQRSVKSKDSLLHLTAKTPNL